MRTSSVPSSFTNRIQFSKRQSEMLQRTDSHLEVLALRARDDGRHYAGYTVGGAALIETPGGFDFVVGSNYKSRPGTNGPRLCAEEELLALASLKGATSVLAITIAAMAKPDDLTGKTMEGALPPCAKCRCFEFRDRITRGDMLSPLTRFKSMLIASDAGHTVIARPCWTVGRILNEFGSDLP